MNYVETIMKNLFYDENIELPDIKKLEYLLSEELARDNPDFELIDEITKAIIELKEIPLKEIDIDSEINFLNRKKIKYHKKRKLPKFAVTAAVVSAIILTNCLASPFIAEGVRNFFPSLLQTKDKVILNFNNSNEKYHDTNIDIEEHEISDIRDFAAFHGMNIYAPEWIPEGEFTVEMEYRTNSDDEEICSFIFDWLQEDLSLSQKSLGLHYELLDDKSRDLKILEISSGSKLQENILIDGIDAYIFFEEDIYTKRHDLLFFTMYFYDRISEDKGILTTAYVVGMDMEEAYKIFESFR